MKKSNIKPGMLVKFSTKKCAKVYGHSLPFMKPAGAGMYYIPENLIGIHIKTDQDEEVLFGDCRVKVSANDLSPFSYKKKARTQDCHVKFTGDTYETEKEFWDLIDSYGYWTKTKNAGDIRADIQAKLSHEEVARLENVFHRLTGILRERIVGMIAGTVSDDSFSDLTSHIIGMGSSEFEAVMLKPLKARVRALSYDYEEGFQYIFFPEI